MVNFAELLGMQGENQFQVPLNCSSSFNMIFGKKMLVHSLEKVGIPLEDNLIKLLSLRGNAIRLESLPRGLRPFVTNDLAPYLRGALDQGSVMSLMGKFYLLHVYSDRESHAVKSTMRALKDLLIESPHLNPKHPVFIIVGGENVAFNDAKKWQECNPTLGGAIFGRSLLFLNERIVEDLERRKKLSESLAHELFHARLGDYSLYFPMWLEEGLAEIVMDQHSKRNFTPVKIVASGGRLQKIQDYVDHGIWQYSESPLVNREMRALTRAIIKKFTMWLIMEAGEEYVFKSALNATLSEPWEKHFNTNAGMSLDGCWLHFTEKYI